MTMKSGDGIVIEERDEDEVLCMDDVRVAPAGCSALNPAFDVTPKRYVTGYITEKGIVKPEEFSKLRSHT
jgi:translation initiation factor eIF-2B subunit alpha/methylthioribose-1-phosphate isomerase